MENLDEAIVLSRRIRMVKEYCQVAKVGKIKLIKFETNTIRVENISKDLDLNGNEEKELQSIFNDFEATLSMYFENTRHKVIKGIKQLK